MDFDIKKTLLVTLDFPPNLGGVATYYYNLCKNLPGDKIVVLAPEQPGDLQFDHQQNFGIVRKKLLNQFPQVMPKTFSGVLKIAASVKWFSLIRYFHQVSKNHGIELIAAGQVLPLGTLALLYQKQKKIPYIFFAHGLDITLPQRFMRKKRLLKKIIAQAKNIVANSHFTMDELIKLGADPKKIIVVYPCPNLSIHQAASDWKVEELRKDLELAGKRVLLTVGRLVERKGHDQVIKALPEIINKFPNTVYIIAGSGSFQSNLQTLVNQNNLGNHVKFLGAVSQGDLAALYQLCEIFIMPSRQLANGDVEGFGIVYLEANLFGKPVIGGQSGGVPEAVLDGKTGLLVNPLSPTEIANAVARLLADPAYAERLGMQGLQRVTEEFDWRVQTEKLKQILM